MNTLMNTSYMNTDSVSGNLLVKISVAQCHLCYDKISEIQEANTLEVYGVAMCSACEGE